MVPMRLASVLACLALLLAPSVSTKVVVEFYGEAMCPFCARFTTDIVAPLFANNVSELMSFTFVPWGNTRQDAATGAVACQHGPQECSLDTLISCVQDVVPDQNTWFPAVACIEKAGFVEKDIQKLILECVPASAAQAVADCYGGDKGKELQEAAGSKTAALVPPHKWVPWVVVNGIPLYDAYKDLQAFVCAAASGDRPPVCYDPPTQGPSMARKNMVTTTSTSWKALTSSIRRSF